MRKIFKEKKYKYSRGGPLCKGGKESIPTAGTQRNGEINYMSPDWRNPINKNLPS